MIYTTGLDGKEYPLKYKTKRTSKRSSHHQQAVDLIKKMYPGFSVCEEVPAKIQKGQTLKIDILVPILWVAVEVHGRQHFEYCPHFHKDMSDFLRAQGRDRDKEEWCELNDIRYVALRYDEKDGWRDQITRAFDFATE